MKPAHDVLHSFRTHVREAGYKAKTARKLCPRLSGLTIVVGMFIHSCLAQDLAPRAYLITPLHSNAINLTYSSTMVDWISTESSPLQVRLAVTVCRTSAITIHSAYLAAQPT